MKAMVKGLIIGGAIAAVGIIMLVTALAVSGWSVSPKYKMQTYASGSADGDISALSVKIDAGSVTCAYYDGEELTIEFPTSKLLTTEISKSGGTLNFRSKGKWYANIGFGKHDVPTTVIKLPRTLYGKIDLKIDLDAGSAELGAGEYKNVIAEVDAGQFSATNITCDVLICEVDAGQIKIGEIKCGYSELDVDAGQIKIDKITSDRTKVTVDAGQAVLGFTGAQSEYTVFVELDAGSCNVGNTTGSTDKTINIDVDAGSVQVTFSV